MDYVLTSILTKWQRDSPMGVGISRFQKNYYGSINLQNPPDFLEMPTPMGESLCHLVRLVVKLPETVLIRAKACLSRTIRSSTFNNLMARDLVSIFSDDIIKTHSGHTHSSVGAVSNWMHLRWKTRGHVSQQITSPSLWQIQQ